MSYFRNLLSLLFFISILLIGLPTWGQDKEVRMIEHSAEETVFDQTFGKDLLRLLGNVWMKHEDMELTCDSAWLNQKKRVFLGFGNVHLIKSDTLELWGERIHYDGVSRIVQADDKVRMEQGEATLITNHLNYNMDEEVAWYYGGGQIYDGTNVLESGWGYYYTDTEKYYFKEKVFLSNEDVTLSTDTLHYDGKKELVEFLGPTQIFGDTNYVYCEAGWYNSQNNISSFYQNALFQSGDQVMKGDSLLYDRDHELFWAYGNVEARDTIENSLIFGEKLFYDEQIDRMEVTENALYIMIEESDSLFLAADTLLSYEPDETDGRKIEAFHSVRFFRDDIQGVCDSMDYMVKDSIIRLYNEPILWQKNNQLTAIDIQIKLKKNGMDNIRLSEKAFLITELDSIWYNQIKGKQIIGYFKDNEMDRAEVTGNGESIFFPEDSNGLIGMNKVICSEMLLVFKDGKINQVKFYKESDSRLIPLTQVSEQDKKLDGFIWHHEIRPKSRNEFLESTKYPNIHPH